MTSAAASPVARPHVREKTAYLEDAERFAAENSSRLPFRFLAWFTRCPPEHRARLAAKVYTESVFQGGGRSEAPLRAWLISCAHPLRYLFTKNLLWRPAPEALVDLETIDRPYFERWFKRVFDPLPAPKRLSPRFPAGFGLPEAAPTAMLDDLCWREAALLFLAPLMVPFLWALSPRANRPKILSAYRQALGTYAVFAGHFTRYPCRHFVTFSDETNHVCRWLAFKQRCAGRFVVVQNGDRTNHPLHAFGIMDDYLVFGPFVLPLLKELRVSAERVEAVGALCLNEWHGLLRDLERDVPAGERERWDLLLIDQSLYPQNGMDHALGQALLQLWDHLDRLKGERPGLRLALQLRNYDGFPGQKAAVLAEARRRFTNGIEVLDNREPGDSYRGVFRSRLVVTIHSTIGIEAFFFGRGKKTLFVNFSGQPFDMDVFDPRFTHEDPVADYGAFVRRVDEALALELDGVPPLIAERHAFFDGRVQERVAEFLLRKVLA